MTDRIRIKQYEQSADEKVSIGGIKWLRKWDVCIQCDSAEEAEALRARLAQPEPEPLWIRNREGKLELHAAQKKEWAGLTDEEIKAIRVSRGDPLALHIEFARAIEAKLKEKNT